MIVAERNIDCELGEREVNVPVVLASVGAGERFAS